MATFRMTKRPASSIVTMTFDYYNQAVAFCEASKLLSPSKPFKKGSQWCVSMIRIEPDSPAVERVEDWEKPGVYVNGKLVYSSYDDWRNAEGLTKLPAHVSEAQIRDRVRQTQNERMADFSWQPLPKFVYEQAHRCYH